MYDQNPYNSTLISKIRPTTEQLALQLDHKEKQGTVLQVFFPLITTAV